MRRFALEVGPVLQIPSKGVEGEAYAPLRQQPPEKLAQWIPRERGLVGAPGEWPSDDPLTEYVVVHRSRTPGHFYVGYGLQRDDGSWAKAGCDDPVAAADLWQFIPAHIFDEPTTIVPYNPGRLWRWNQMLYGDRCNTKHIFEIRERLEYWEGVKQAMDERPDLYQENLTPESWAELYGELKAEEAAEIQRCAEEMQEIEEEANA